MPAPCGKKAGSGVELYRLYDAVADGSIRIRGQSYDLTAITERALARLAGSIGAEVNRLWSNDWDIDAVLLSGGGAVLAPLLDHELLPQPGGDARYSSVLGYRKYDAHIRDRASSQ